jgi:hypothetical protein
VEGASTIPAEISVPDRVLLFYVASDTEWAGAGVTRTTAMAMVVRGLTLLAAADEMIQ